MPSENDLELDLLMEAIKRYSDAKQEHDEAYKRYQGYSWGYHGNQYIEAVDEARKEAKDALRRVIAHEVRQIITNEVKVALKEND
jgi:hypothetical protein